MEKRLIAQTSIQTSIAFYLAPICTLSNAAVWKSEVLGDFNIAPADIDVYDADKWCDQILCSIDERRRFQQILALRLKCQF